MSTDAVEADIVVVGAGIAGALAASKLRRAGLSVVILEAGRVVTDRMELVERYVTASRKSMGAPYRTPDTDANAPGPDGSDGPEYYDHAGSPDTFKATYPRLAGGATWHWRGNVPRHVPNDFRMKSMFGLGVDWPLTYDDLEPWYAAAEWEIGVAGDHAEWNGYLGAARSRPFPMQRVWQSYGDTRVIDRIGSLVFDGHDVRVMSTPQARNTQPFDGRPVCTGNSTCDPICPIAAKYDATVHIARAIAAGAELRDRCVATEIVVDETRQVRSVRFRRWDGTDGAVAAKVVVLAAHAIENAKLLLLSTSRHAPAGVANSSDQVGRNLMDHLQGQGATTFAEPLYPFRGPPTTSGIDVFRDGAFRSSRAAFRMSVGNDGWGQIEGPYATLGRLVKEGKFGNALREAVADQIPRQFRLSYSTEVLPEPHNRVTLSEKTDGLGIRRPLIHFRVSDYNRAAFLYARSVVEAIFRRVGSSGLRFNEGYSSANHIIGTCRMGTDPATSVVDTFGRSHDHSNLFVLGASMFPTAGTANPTLTMAALVLRALPAIENAARTKGAK